MKSDGKRICTSSKRRKAKYYVNIFSAGSKTKAGQMIQELINMGVPKESLFQLVDNILNENYYSLMLALDGETSLGGIQMMYKLFDEDGNELTGSGDIESEAFEQFMCV